MINIDKILGFIILASFTPHHTMPEYYPWVWHTSEHFPSSFVKIKLYSCMIPIIALRTSISDFLLFWCISVYHFVMQVIYCLYT